MTLTIVIIIPYPRNPKREYEVGETPGSQLISVRRSPEEISSKPPRRSFKDSVLQMNSPREIHHHNEIN
jgi:hypothetical protein